MRSLSVSVGNWHFSLMGEMIELEAQEKSDGFTSPGK